MPRGEKTGNTSKLYSILESDGAMKRKMKRRVKENWWKREIAIITGPFQEGGIKAKT